MNEELLKLIEKLEGLLEKAKKGPWKIEAHRGLFGASVWKSQYFITSPNVPNVGYPNRNGIVASFEDSGSFDKEWEGFKKPERELVTEAINNLPLLLKELKLRIQIEEST